MALNIVKEKLIVLKRKKRVMGCIAVVLTAAIVSAVLFRSKNVNNQAAEMSVRSSVAEKGDISTTIVGTGTLENGDAADVIIPTGIKVEKVLVESGDTVVKGQQLATLNEASIAEKLLEVEESLEDIEDEIDNLSSDADDSSTTEYLKAKVLSGKKEELSEAETKLKKLLKSKEITASRDGVISGVYVEEDTAVSGSREDEEDSSGTNANGGNLSVKSTDKSGSGDIMFLSADVSGSEGNDVSPSDTGEEDKVKISSCTVEVTAPVTGAKPQTELGAADYFTGTISWDCSSETFQEETAYTATIKLTAKNGYEFSKNILPEVKGADVSWEVLESDSGESILRIKAKFTKTGKAASDQQGADNSQESAQSNAQTQEDGQSQSQSGNGSGSVETQEKKSSGSVSGSVSAKGSAGGSSGSASGSSSSGSTGSDASGTEYSGYETAAFSIAEQDSTTVSINVDELDILSVKEGQSAQITLDALEDQSFEGTITGISEAVSGSGSTKYPVEITLERAEDMRVGMSASATIYIDEAKDAVLIPVSALQERGDKAFVYTEKDGEGNLSGETEVTTGLSDGNRVEIVSGLSEGDTVYYLRAGSEDSESTQQFPGMNGMPGGAGMSGGGKPQDGGGNRPEGSRQNGRDRSNSGNQGDGK